MSEPLPQIITASEVLGFGYSRAVEALEYALRHGLDTASDPPRTGLPVGPDATLYSMPSIGADAVSIKIVTHRADNTRRGLPTVHGIHIQFDPDTLAPVAVMDGAALTTLRTPAVSVAAVRPALRRFDEPLNLVIFGLGPQGLGHLEALIDVATASGDFPTPRNVTFVTRHPASRRLPHRPPVTVTGITSDNRRLESVLAAADVVVCATGSRKPLFDSSALGPRTVVIAIGTHDPDHREVDANLCARATVIVEDLITAQRSFGEIIDALADGSLTSERLVSMADVLAEGGDHAIAGDRPVLFSGGGMGWQDRIVGAAITRASLMATPDTRRS
jgi:ornithine cyclodeaminase